MSSSRAPWPPITPRGINITAPAKYDFPKVVKSPTVIAAQKAKQLQNHAMEQSGQNESCKGKGCLGRMRNRIGQLTTSVGKATGMYGGRTRRTRRKTRRTHRKTRHSRR